MPERDGADSAAFAPRVHRELRDSGVRHHHDISSLVFADLSGFTPLSERFAKRGQVGAELLTDLLNELFAPILDHALERGGDLLKFGGDALLLRFSRAGDHATDDHAAAAVASAWSMQQILTATARRRRVDVGMSVGVATGELHLYLAGGRVPELVACGPVVDRCLELETAASSGQVLVDVPAASLRAIGAEGRDTNGAVHLHEVANPTAPVVHLTNEARRGDTLLDPAVADAVAAGAAPEHRRAVVAFGHFRVPEPENSAATAPLLDRVFDSVRAACDETSVCVMNCDADRGGGKLILTAGVPSTTGDDVDRMLHCCLRVLSDVGDTGIRFGVNEGRIFAGPVGSPRRRAYTIIGDAVNLAARVMGHAPDATLLATSGVLRRSREAFETVRLEPFVVKGKTDPVEAEEVIRPTGRRIERTDATHLRGRDRELARLTSAARDAIGRRRGAAIEIVGPAGIGKSRLTAALISDAGARALTVEAGRYLANSPYGAIADAFVRLTGLDGTAPERVGRDALLQLVRRVVPHLEAWLPFLGIPLGIQIPDTEQTAGIAPEFRPRRVHQVFGDLLLETFPSPHVVLIEDSHWMDDASSELLTAVAPRLLDAGWLLVSTRRPEPTGWQMAEQAGSTARSFDAEVMDLRPLSATAIGELATDLAASTPLPDHVTRVLVERSHGNPLFLEELIRATAAGADIADLPDRVEVLIEARIDRLAAADRSALRTAAVLGARFTASTLGAVSPDAIDRIPNLDEFLHRSDADEIRFHHALFRDTAYQTLPVRERRRLHGAVAAVIEERSGADRDEWAELLATHWFHAGEAARAWPFLRSAAARATADLAPLEASRFLEQALQCVRQLPADERTHRTEVELALGELYETLGRFTRAEAMFRAARRHASTPEDAASSLGREARVARSMRSLTTAVRRYRRALREVPPEAYEVRAQLLVGLASVYEYQGRHRDKLALLEAAIDDAALAGDKKTLAHAHLLIGNTYGDLGEPGGREHLETALMLFEATDELWGIASSQNNLGVESYYEGDWNEALRRYGLALDGFVRIGDETSHATMLNNIAEIHSDQGHWDLAQQGFEGARRMWRASGFALGVALAASNLGRLATRTGDLVSAEQHFDDARDGFTQIKAKGFLLELDARLAAWHLRRGDVEAALELAQQTLAEGGDELQPTVICQLERITALALHRDGGNSTAIDHIDRSIDLAMQSDALFEQAANAVAATEMGMDVEDPSSKWVQLGVVSPARRPW